MTSNHRRRLVRLDFLLTSLILVSSSCSETGNGTGPLGEGGRILWRVPSAYGEMAHDPAANANGTMVYFLTADYRLRKIRGTDGHVVWDVPVGAPRRTPPGWNAVLSGGSVIVTKVDLFAFDTTTGAERWSYVAPDLDETGYWPVVVDDSTVYATTPMTRVYAIDARTGVARWIVDLSEGTEDNGAMPPVLADSTLYVCTRTVAYPPAGVLWAIDARTGGVRWRHALDLTRFSGHRVYAA